MEKPMPTLRMRLTASEDDAGTLINYVSSLDGIESAEEIADLMPHMDDPDSSSAGLSDVAGPGTHLIKVIGGNDIAIKRALEVSEACAHDMGAALEVVDNHER
jgi:hypothetical protein